MEIHLTIFLTLLFLSNADMSFGNLGPLSETDLIRNSLFPQVVQDFVVDALQEFLTVFDDPDAFSVQRITPEEAFSVFYDMVYKTNQEAGNPNAKFHALSKAQSIKENYEVIDGGYLILATAYSAGELLLQNEVLTASTQKNLSSHIIEEVIRSLTSVTFPTVENNIRAAYDGYVNFLKSYVGIGTKTKAFTEPAVFVEVVNALKL